MPNGIAANQEHAPADPQTALAELRRTARQPELENLPEVREAIVMIHKTLQEAFRPVGFVDEATAALITGRSARWLTRRHADWHRVGGARIVHGRREYRSCVLPQKGIHHSYLTRV